MTFDLLGLSEPLCRAVHKHGYTIPTPIQARAIPAILEGKDILAAAQTGTGKTAGFTLPLLQLLSDKPRVRAKQTRALVLTPTRELAAQVQQSVKTYGKFLDLKSAVIFGGVKMSPQIKQLHHGVDILVATPGRLLDLYRQGAVRFEEIEFLVLDEADRMLDMGFINDIKTIMGMMPKQRQNLMFSATFTDSIRQLARRITNNPVEIDVAPRNSTIDRITQIIYTVDKSRKAELLSHMIQNNNWYQVLVFSRTKHGADKLVKSLAKNNIRAEAIHGNKSQSQRTRALSNFKRNRAQVMVATDIASRGIDIIQLSHVVNFDLPHVPEDYIHRIGRTGRAGADGHAISLVSADEANLLRDIEKLIRQKIAREEVEGFEPRHHVLDSARPETKNKRQGNHKKTSHRKGQSRSGNEQQAHGKAHKQGNQQGNRHNKRGNASRRGTATAHML